MSTVKDLYAYLNEIAPFQLQEGYDNAGLIVGDWDSKISGVMVCLDSTEVVVKEAIENDCNVIVSHHPIIFSGLKTITGKNYIERTIVAAIKNDISIIAIHTNLDNILTNGVNAKIAEKLELVNTKIMNPVANITHSSEQVGAGIIGKLRHKMTPDSFTNYLKQKMNIDQVRRTKYISEEISKIAICGGSGSFLLGNAIKLKADVFITADFKYHQFFDANDKIVIYDIGHYESEKYTIELLKDLIRNNFSNFAVRYTKHNTNPVFYN